MSAMKRLLVVDDEEALTFGLYQSFIRSEKDYEVVTASSGNEAWEKFQDKAFDLVLTDISMPGMTGFELLEKVKDIKPETEVIVMTAYGVSFRKDEALEKGARHYIEKPFDIKEVKRLVLSILED